MKPKFTPGPWTIEQPGPEVCSFPTLEIYGGSRIALVHGNGKLTSGADARLIAAAPDLYAVVRELSDLCPRMSDDDPIGPAIRDAIMRGRAALAKAEGRDAL